MGPGHLAALLHCFLCAASSVFPRQAIRHQPHGKQPQQSRFWNEGLVLASQVPRPTLRSARGTL